MDWYAQQLFAAEQAAANVLFCFYAACLFKKVFFGVPKPQSQYFRLATGISFIFKPSKSIFGKNRLVLSMCCNILSTFDNI